jgi:CPA1 family monovalent cation:H+ antiporter
MLARRIRLSYTVGLVLAGIAIASFRAEGETYLTHDLVFRVILPPLLFEAALNIHWQELRRDALPFSFWQSREL